jgi:hypothetical protein
MSKALKFLSLTLLVVMAVGLVLTSAPSPTKAQDNGPITCDSSLVLMLLIAQQDYGFHSQTLDLARFERGQYAPLFTMLESDPAWQESQLSNQPGMTGQDQAGQTDQTGQAGQSGQTDQSGQAGQSDQAGQTDQSGQAGQSDQAGQVTGITLQPATIQGEDQYCSQLRTELVSFLSSEIQVGHRGGWYRESNMSNQTGQGSQGAQGGQAGESGQSGMSGDSGSGDNGGAGGGG